MNTLFAPFAIAATALVGLTAVVYDVGVKILNDAGDQAAAGIMFFFGG